MKLLWCAASALLATVIGCNGSSDSNSGDDDALAASHGGNGAGGSNAQPSSSAGNGVTCSVKGAPDDLIAETLAKELQVTESDVFFLDTPSYPFNRIHRLSLDGTSDSIAYQTPGDGELQSFSFNDDYFFVIERYVDDDHNDKMVLKRVPRTGGESELLTKDGGTDFKGGYIFATTDSAVFLLKPGDDTNRVVRVDLPAGEATVIATSDGSVPIDLQLVGDSVWYSANQGTAGFFKADAAASGPSGERVGMDFCAHQMSVTSVGILCGGAFGIGRYDLNGGEPSTILSLQEGPVSVSRPDGNDVYFYPEQGPGSGLLRKVPVDGTEATQLACNRRSVLELTFNSKYIYWLESVDGVRHIFRLAK